MFSRQGNVLQTGLFKIQSVFLISLKFKLNHKYRESWVEYKLFQFNLIIYKYGKCIIPTGLMYFHFVDKLNHVDSFASCGYGAHAVLDFIELIKFAGSESEM